ncbi:MULTISPECIES: hypothetical protein [unclassified Pseudoalteromonas]|uniref:hypothetical protein n=1 Tax=unclassified Pseudoalteromonas TaxID=194690 RepID=UPI0004072F1B|nr:MULTISPECIES: hypothetical protein [unclassified Pseudoalteromonas]TMP78587.1 hypothetical protein CWB71_17725 [Pseudoalteromonas sp. S983]WRU74768.1 hypothetical protein VOI46_18845 [Pseudoalteromonas sp. CuT 4-3]
MATCVQLEYGELKPTAQSIEDCTGFVMLEPTEYQQFILGSSIFDPSLISTEQAQALFVSGFSLVIICYLVSWGYGAVINWFKPENDN